MGKSVYSILLTDELVTEIDKLAYVSNTSRSNLIDTILANYCSYQTPQMRITDIFNYIEEKMQSSIAYQTNILPSQSMISIKSALEYKYNPIIRYKLELYKEYNLHLGEITASFRTQNNKLISIFVEYLLIWDKIERLHTFEIQSQVDIQSGKYRRIINCRENNFDKENIAYSVLQYITIFDQCLKLYISSIDSTQTVLDIQDIYENELVKNEKIRIY